MATHSVDPTEVSNLLDLGLRNRWYPIAPSWMIKDKPVGLTRLGERIAVWRDGDGEVHVTIAVEIIGHDRLGPVAGVEGDHGRKRTIPRPTAAVAKQHPDSVIRCNGHGQIEDTVIVKIADR